MPGYDARKYVSVAERVSAATWDDRDPEARNIVRVERVFFQMLNEVTGIMTYEIEIRGGIKAQGSASFRLDLQGKSAQATNPIEDAETSAVGRALAMLGFHADRGIASAEEVRIARAREDAPSAHQASRMARQQREEELTVEEARGTYFTAFADFLGGTTTRHIAEKLGIEEQVLKDSLDLSEPASWQKLYRRTQRAVNEQAVATPPEHEAVEEEAAVAA